jgi:hypothetical protein
MKRGYHKYTSEDDKIILNIIRDNPSNLKMCFEEAAEKTGTTSEAIRSRYYKKLRHNNVCFIVVGKKHQIANTKNRRWYNDVKTMRTTKTTKTFWKTLCNLFKFK